MVRITDQLLVSRAEHNDGALASLEEISLHQQKLDKIEYINRVCSNLKILQLQDNCIEKIENLGRLKVLEYLNLAINNIEKIENLEGLESLNKLDLTLNFVGEMTNGIASLKCNEFLQHLFLMGNPCTEFPHYRDFVIAMLPQLETLDGADIERSERIKAVQNLPWISSIIQEREEKYAEKRKIEKDINLKNIEEKRSQYDDPNLDLDAKRKNFYDSESKHTPEYRRESQRFKELLEEEDERKKNEETKFGFENEYDTMSKRPRRLFHEKDGRALNVNEAKIDFRYDDSDPVFLIVELELWKHLDASLVNDLVVEPTYLRVTIKGKIFQLRFLEEVHCNDESVSAQRNKASGHFIIKMRKLKQDAEGLINVYPDKTSKPNITSKLSTKEKNTQPDSIKACNDALKTKRENVLEVGSCGTWNQEMDFSRIVKRKSCDGTSSEDDEDVDDMPPLEDDEDSTQE